MAIRPQVLGLVRDIQEGRYSSDSRRELTRQLNRGELNREEQEVAWDALRNRFQSLQRERAKSSITLEEGEKIVSGQKDLAIEKKGLDSQRLTPAQQANYDRGFIQFGPTEDRGARIKAAVDTVGLRGTLPISTRSIPQDRDIIVERVEYDLGPSGGNPRERFSEFIGSATPEKAAKGTAEGVGNVFNELVVEPVKGAGTFFRRVQFEALEAKGSDISKAPKWVQGFLGQRPSKQGLESEEGSFIAATGFVAAGGGILGAPGRAVVKGATTIYPVTKVGSFLSDPSFETLGEAGTAFAIPKVADKAGDVFSRETLSGLLRSKKGTVGGRPANVRAGRITKAELRKQSFQAQRNPNVFFDQGEVGVRIRTPELKAAEFTKERVIRYGAGEGGPRIVSVRDIQLGGRGSLVTAGESFKGSPTQPGFRKLYPRGFGSQSVIRSGNLDLVGVTLQRQRSTNMFNTGRVPQAEQINIPIQRTSGEPTGGPVQVLEQKPVGVFQSQRAQARGGFRPQVREKLFQRINERQLFSQRTRFSQEALSGTELLPKVEIAPKTKVSPADRIFAKFRLSEIVGPRIKISSRSDTRAKVTPKLSFDIAQAVTQDTALDFATPSPSPIGKIKRSPRPAPRPRPKDNAFSYIRYVPQPVPRPRPKDDGRQKPLEETTGLFDFDLKKIRFPKPEKGSIKYRNRKLGYTPSLVGIAFNIKAKRKSGLFTGLELRGV